MNVNVAAGVLIRTGRVLLCQRGAEREKPKANERSKLGTKKSAVKEP